MSRLLCIGMTAALACACGRSDNRTPDTTATDTAAPPAASGAAGNGAVGTSGSNATMVLTGCLQRTGDNPVGTTGSKMTPPATPAESADFILAHATAGARDPIATGTDSYVLEGGDLAGHERQMVRVTGHFPDPLAGGVLSNRPANAAPPDRSAAGVDSGTSALTPNAKQRAQRGDANATDVAHMRHVQVESVEMVAKCSAK